MYVRRYARACSGRRRTWSRSRTSKTCWRVRRSLKVAALRRPVRWRRSQAVGRLWAARSSCRRLLLRRTCRRSDETNHALAEAGKNSSNAAAARGGLEVFASRALESPHFVGDFCKPSSLGCVQSFDCGPFLVGAFQNGIESGS